jgi:hypothetical protein
MRLAPGGSLPETTCAVNSRACLIQGIEGERRPRGQLEAGELKRYANADDLFKKLSDALAS